MVISPAFWLRNRYSRFPWRVHRRLVPLARQPGNCKLADMEERLTVKERAALFNVSKRMIYHARRVARSGREDLFRAAERGEMTVHAALRIDPHQRFVAANRALFRQRFHATYELVSVEFERSPSADRHGVEDWHRLCPLHDLPAVDQVIPCSISASSIAA